MIFLDWLVIIGGPVLAIFLVGGLILEIFRKKGD